MAITQPKVLYFINGPVPSPNDNVAANGLRGRGANVSFRNARYADGDQHGAPEAADGVLGAIPESYKKHTTADEAMTKYEKAVEDENARLTQLASKPGAATDNFGTATLSDPGRRPVAAQTQGPGLTGGPAPSPATPTSPLTATVGIPSMGAIADATGAINGPGTANPVTPPAGTPMAQPDGTTAGAQASAGTQAPGASFVPGATNPFENKQ
jgi:hypothetical protein